jgi:hypothetical protein
MDPRFRPIQECVTELSRTAEIEVRAPAQAAFDIVAAEILAIEDHTAELTGHRPIDEGPLRVGFRWQKTVVHDRSVCRTGWIVTELREPCVLEKATEHLCLARRRAVMGGERWQFEETGDGLTVVTLRAWQSWPGLRGRLGRLFAPRDDAAGFSLRKRLASVQLRAERGSPRTA